MSRDRLNELSNTFNQLNVNLSSQQSRLSSAESTNRNTTNQLSQAAQFQSDQQSELQSQRNSFNALTNLLNMYRQSEGIALSPGIAVINAIDAGDLVNTDVLKDSIRKKIIADFDAAITKVTNINWQDSEGKTILMHCAINGFYHGVDKLLNLGADANITDDKGANALIYFANASHITYFKKLADKTSDLNHKAHGLEGNSALHILIPATNNIIFISEIFQEFGYTHLTHITGSIEADISCTIGSIVLGARTSDGYTINQEKTLSLIKYLVSKGADINIPNDQNVTPFHVACTCIPSYIPKQFNDLFPIDYSLKDIKNNTALHFASAAGDKAMIELILSKNLDINAQNIGGGTPLLQACSNNKKDNVEYLLQRGANLNIADNEGKHAWHYAALTGALEVMQFLKSRISNIDLKTTDSAQLSALWLTCHNGHLEATEWLINQGADKNIKNSVNGITALQIAVVNGQDNIVKLLINRGTNSNIADNTGWFPIHNAVSVNKLEILKLLVNPQNINQQTADINKITPLWLAAQDGYLELVKFLANAGANLNAPRESNGLTPIHMALQKQHPEVAKELILRGANIAIVDKNGDTILHYASRSLDDNQDVIQLALNKGINVNTQNIGGGTPLLQACYHNKKANIEYLLQHGANLNILDNNGLHPWHYAALSGALEAMQFLKSLISTIDLKTASNDQYTALWLACQNGQLEAAKWLIEQGADTNASRLSDGRTALQAAICNKHFEIVKFLVDQHIDINKTDKNLESPLYYSVQFDTPEGHMITKYLLEHSANMKILPANQYTPLHMASWFGNISAVKMLIEAGASINAVDDKGYSPMYSALWEKENISKEKKLTVAKYLLLHSASTNQISNEGETVAEICAKYLPEAVEILQHPEILPSLQEFEATLIGIDS